MTTTTTGSTRTVLRVDAALDTTIAAVCLAVAAGSWSRPPWLATPVLVVLAVVLLGFACGLLWLARRPDRTALLALGVGNGLCAVACVLWGVLGGPGQPELRVTAVAVGIALGAVAVAQLIVGRRR